MDHIHESLCCFFCHSASLITLFTFIEKEQLEHTTWRGVNDSFSFLDELVFKGTVAKTDILRVRERRKNVKLNYNCFWYKEPWLMFKKDFTREKITLKCRIFYHSLQFLKRQIFRKPQFSEEEDVMASADSCCTSKTDLDRKNHWLEAKCQVYCYYEE